MQDLKRKMTGSAAMFSEQNFLWENKGEKMEIVESMQNDCNVFKLTGNLTSSTSSELEKKIFDAIDHGTRNIILDFKDLEYISSAGLRVVVKTTKNLKQSEGALVLCSMQDYVREVFEIAGFDSFLTIVPTLDNAMEKF